MIVRLCFSRLLASTILVSSITLQSSTTHPEPLCLSAFDPWQTPKRSTQLTSAGCRWRRPRCAASVKRRHRPSTSQRRPAACLRPPTDRGRCWTLLMTWSYTGIWAATFCRAASTLDYCNWPAVGTPSMFLCRAISLMFCHMPKSVTILTSLGSYVDIILLTLTPLILTQLLVLNVLLYVNFASHV